MALPNCISSITHRSIDSKSVFSACQWAVGHIGARPQVGEHFHFPASLQIVRGKKRLTQSEKSKIKAARKPYVETKSYLKTAPLPTVNPIFGTYSPIVKHILKTLRTEDEKALTKDPAEELFPTIGKDTLGFGIEQKELQHITRGLGTALIVRASPAIYGDSATPPPTVKAERLKTEAVKRILALNHGSATQERSFLVQMAIKHFGSHALDTGSAESQAAIQTVHILAMAEHLRYNPHDAYTKREITMKVQQRNSMLKYLRNLSLTRYNVCLQKLGLTNESVTSEFRYNSKLLL
ncbi:hypothetical protein V1512DRAFT_262739 [Lipomyces arxii]|uniref:mitochondrial 37S ribosomal protein uS15m n=1 Tax=Lipomyces arxii TaxID=56418 RepID=UPI0034CEA484